MNNIASKIINIMETKKSKHKLVGDATSIFSWTEGTWQCSATHTNFQYPKYIFSCCH